MDFTFNLLKDLTEASEVAGYVALVRTIVRKYMQSLGELFGDKRAAPRIMMSAAARHIYYHNSIIHRDDYEWAASLLSALIQRLDKATAAGLIA